MLGVARRYSHGPLPVILRTTRRRKPEVRSIGDGEQFLRKKDRIHVQNDDEVISALSHPGDKLRGHRMASEAVADVGTDQVRSRGRVGDPPDHVISPST